MREGLEAAAPLGSRADEQAGTWDVPCCSPAARGAGENWEGDVGHAALPAPEF